MSCTYARLRAYKFNQCLRKTFYLISDLQNEIETWIEIAIRLFLESVDRRS